ncbi:hypothetical protein [Paraburkholderia saeva]|uniref:hypothetical protein n=1 Tax=Paraburkholderia saeva TaxID=2777537 RepID=UPI001D30DB40|nr:hypothetical protein [Paraburkholderia saeva]CAG4914861.1 hypothetical protein R70241_04281 [Paraburkholderia saeva]
MKHSLRAAVSANALALLFMWSHAYAAPLPPPEVEVAVGRFPEGRISLTDYVCPKEKIGSADWSIAIVNKPDGSRQAGCYADVGNNHLLIRWLVNQQLQPPVAYDFMKFDITPHGAELVKGSK